MRTSFNTVSIGEIAKVRSGYAFKSKDWTDAGVPVVKIANVKDGELVMDGCSFVSRSVADEAREWLLREGDILIAMTGYIGDVARVRGCANRLLNQRVGRFEVVANDACESDYLYYVLRSDEIKHDIKALGYGSAQPNVSPRLIQSVKIPLPRPDEQRAIARVLGALDDKIEQNRHTARALEKLARAIFRAWFVDFEPVKAKAAGATSFPSMPQTVFDALPTCLVDSAIGPVPEGWEVKAIGDMASIKGGKQLARDRFSDDGQFPVFGGAGVMGRTADHNAEGFVISVGRVGAYCGRFFSHRGKAWINNNASVIVPSNDVPDEWLFLALGFVNMDIIKKGAAQPFVSNGDISKIENVWPDRCSLTSFTEKVVTLLRSAEASEHESRKLAQMRDYLLPKLLSGAVRVRDAERAAAAVT